MVHRIGIDLGGTRIKGVALSPEGELLHQLYMPTNDGEGAVWKTAVAETVRLLQQEINAQQIVVGIAAPGLPNKQHTAIACMPGRMQGLENFTWQELLQQPCFVLNDAVAALMAESRMGAAKNKKQVILLTLGTGVGGAILINGEPYLGAFQKAGHLGHVVINDEGECDITGMPGSLEDCIGNCTIRKRTEGKFGSTRELLQAAENGDAFAQHVWQKSVRQLAIGLASFCNTLSPECIVLGGGITEAGDALFLPLREYMNRYEWRPLGTATPIVKAAFGDLAGAIGAACFAGEAG